MAMTLAQLQSQLSGLETYTPESEEVLRQRAQAVYDPQYNQDLAALRDNLQQSVNATERGAIRTGMQRSSYNNASLVGLVGAGQKAQAQLAAQREGNIANLLLQLVQAEKDRKADADKQRDNLLLNLYQLGQPSNNYSYYGGGNSGLTPTGNDKAAGDTPKAATLADILGSMTNVTSITGNAVNNAYRNLRRSVPYGTAVNSATGGSGKNYLQQREVLPY